MASPLTLLLPVIPGIDPSTFGQQLQGLQEELNEALATIGTVHYARFLFLDRSTPNLLPGPTPSSQYVVGVVTEYDGSFEAYIGDFVAKVGMAFDQLLKIVVGGQALIPVANNVAAFQAFIAQNDASQNPPNTEAMYQAYPKATVQEILASLPS
jgi:hypothetical protein